MPPLAVNVIAGYLLSPEEVDKIASIRGIPPESLKESWLAINDSLRAKGISTELIPVSYPKKSAEAAEKMWFIVASDNLFQNYGNLKLIEPGEDAAKVKIWLETYYGMGQLKFQTIWDPYGDRNIKGDAPKQF